MTYELANRLNLNDLLAEFDAKTKGINKAIDKLNSDKSDFRVAATVSGGMSGEIVNIDYPSRNQLVRTIRFSAWDKLYKIANLDMVLTAKDKDKFQTAMVNPPEFTKENIIATFGEHIINPRQSILRGLAEVFSGLDPYYRSHEKVKIGAKGVPKRVIISGTCSFYVREKIKDIINALSVYQGLPLVDLLEIDALIKDGLFLLTENIIDNGFKKINSPNRGVWLKTYRNGNGHLYFDENALKDINGALAEYYGEVLPDSPEAKKSKRQTSEVSKDLQYYPTPISVIENYMIGSLYKKAKVLEPSCGCGRILDQIRKVGAEGLGIEFDATRVNTCRSKGHNVRQANFLNVEPVQEFDFVVMNPPFYGKHYAKHIFHAFEFLKDGGKLISVLPSTARYDHNALDDLIQNNYADWIDLPVGSFSESGTNISTSILTVRKQKRHI